MWAYTRDLYLPSGTAETVDVDQIKRHHYAIHVSINPTRTVPVGPVIDFEAPPGRG